MKIRVCLFCGAEPSSGSHPLGTPCSSCGKTLILTEVEVPDEPP